MTGVDCFLGGRDRGIALMTWLAQSLAQSWLNLITGGTIGLMMSDDLYLSVLRAGVDGFEKG